MCKIITSILLFFAALSTLRPAIPAFAAPARVKIGVSLPLTGEASTYGGDLRRVIEYANEKIASGRYQLIFEDDKCSGKDAVSVAHKFKEFERVQFVLGPVCSGAALSAAPIYEAAKIPSMTLGASAPALSKAGRYIFRMGPNDQQTGETLFNYVESQGYQTIGVLTEQTDYCLGLTEVFRLAQEKSKLRMRGVYEEFAPGAVDYRTQLLRLKKAGIQGLFFNVQAEAQAINVVKQTRALNWPVALYAAYYPSSPVFVKEVGTLAEGLVFVDLPLPEETLDAAGSVIYREFHERHGKLVSHPVFFIYGYEGFRTAHESLTSGMDPVDFLLSGHKFAGVAGPYYFDASGDVSGISQVMRIFRGGLPEKIPSVPFSRLDSPSDSTR